MAALGSSVVVVENSESIAATPEKSAEQETGSAEKISRAAIADAAFKQASYTYPLLFPTQEKTSRIFEVFYGSINDIRAWRLLYGPTTAIVLAMFGRKSVWKMQAELLGRPGRPDPGDSGDPDDPGGPGDAWGCHGPNDRAAEEYKRTIEAESGRIGVSGTIIASIAVAALSLPSLSQTHWIARASWIFSLVASLLAVYYANNQSWKAGYLLLGNRVRAWIRGDSKGPHDYIRENDYPGRNLVKDLVWSFAPDPSSVLTVSAPGLLLSASLCFLLIGFGVYLGFMWTRALDDLAGPDDNREVFIIYIVSLIFCYGLYSMSDAAHDRKATDTVGRTIQGNFAKFITRYEMSQRRREERRQLAESKLRSEQWHHERRVRMEEEDMNDSQQRLMMQIDLSMEILKALKETNALIKLRNIATTQEASY